MAKETELIGKVLNFNETNYARTINVYKKLLSIVNDIGADYEKYGFGTFTQEAYNDILQNRSKNIKLRYDKQLRDSIDALKITSPTIRENMLKQAAKDMDIFTAKIDGMDGLFNQWITISSGVFTTGLPIYLEQIKIVDGKAVIDKSTEQMIKEEVTSSITTATQAEVYQLYLEMKPTFDKMANLLKQTKSSCDIFNIMPSNDALLYTDDDGHLQFCGALIHLVK